MGDQAREEIKKGNDAICIYGRRKGYSDIPCIKVGGFFSFWFHVALTTVFDMHGHGSNFKTKRIVKILKKENPDVIHLHNVHGYYLNLPILFDYLKNEYKGKIEWTLHDCWTFTGHCAHFSLVNCEKWKLECSKCPNKKRYPISLFCDRSKKNYLEKKNMFTGLKNVTIITPSDWLKDKVIHSFLREYNVITIHNAINTNIFRPIKNSNILDKYNISTDRKILLGVASVWTKEKGYYDFIKLSKQIPSNYVIVMVGINKKQYKEISKINNMVGILRTDNQHDLAKLYSSAEYFINLTYEDTYPTVNLEANACGCKVITYDTGGCKEIKYYRIYDQSDIASIINLLKSESDY